MNIDIQDIIAIAQQAGDKIMEIYNDPDQDFELDRKDDNSPLTKADMAAHHCIVDGLIALYPDMPILSEESDDIPYETRQQRDQFRLVDPLDGTKEFIKKNGEFTVNIALIDGQDSVLGVVYVPATGKTYYAQQGQGAYMVQDGKIIKLATEHIPVGGELKVVGSRSHHAPEVEQYVADLESQGYTSSFVSAGSSLKFCLLAEGSAHVYPRFVPTMERDTAAAHIILTEAGGDIRLADGSSLVYHRAQLRNDFFVAVADPLYFVS